MRRVVAIVAGYSAYTFCLEGIFDLLKIDAWTRPDLSSVALSISFAILAALLSGYLAHLIDDRERLRCARLVSLAIGLSALLVLISRVERGLSLGWWFPVSILIAPFSLVGGYWRQGLRDRDCGRSRGDR